MKVSPDTSQVLFRHEYEHELDTWLRRRFAYLCITYVVLGAINLLASALALLGLSGAGAAGPLVIATSVTAGEGAVSLAIVALFFLRRHRHESRDDVLRAATWMILALGTVSLAARALAQWAGLLFPGSVVLAIFFWHFTACLFLPWTPRDSLRPILPLLVAWVLSTLLFKSDTGIVPRLLSVMFSPGIEFSSSWTCCPFWLMT